MVGLGFVHVAVLLYFRRWVPPDNSPPFILQLGQCNPGKPASLTDAVIFAALTG